MRIRVGLVILFALPLTMNGEKPYTFANTPGKLPKEIRPGYYAIRIVPDIDKLTFAGEEIVKLQAKTFVREIVLNAADLNVTEVRVDNVLLSPTAIKLDPNNELLTIALPRGAAQGDHTLALEFSGKITPKGRGFYYMPYQEQDTGAKKIALGTQFEPSDARRFFPCWDEPSFRAFFQLTAVVPENWVAVSNMPIESERKISVPEGSKEVRFQQTPPMSSYLNVFVAGELDEIETKIAGTDTVVERYTSNPGQKKISRQRYKSKTAPLQVRVIATKGKAESGRYAIESTAQILQYYNDYFGVRYPLPKLDQIAIPGGFGGAMENWGGITYYESALLFDPKKSSVLTKQRIYEVIAHETAHQWFGDLVTMAWWDNLWLNEGFASWMGSKCTAHFNPDWEVWLARNIQRDPTRRTGIAKEVAMEGDARSTTHAIQQPVANESDANSAFDDITYRKGQSFLRMLESFLGEAAFRDGIRRYIAAHKYSNSTTADLWNALSEASGKPVGEIAAAWTEQPGFPVVTMKRDGEKASLSQERFTINFPNAPALEWKIPLTYFVVSENKIESRLMNDKIDKLQKIPVDHALKVNADGAGNYRVEYDEPSWKLLLDALPKLSVADRVNLMGDAWAFVQANRAPLSTYFDLIERLPAGVELAEREQIINAFDCISRLLVGNPSRGKFQSYARSILRPTFDLLGWEPKKDETPRAALLRASLIDALGDLDDQEIVAGCRERFQKYIVDPASVAPDLRPSIFRIVGRYTDDATWNKL